MHAFLLHPSKVLSSKLIPRIETSVDLLRFANYSSNINYGFCSSLTLSSSQLLLRMAKLFVKIYGCNTKPYREWKMWEEKDETGVQNFIAFITQLASTCHTVTILSMVEGMVIALAHV
jgi:hypothetical protein